MVTKKLAKARAFFQRNVCEFIVSVGAIKKPCDYADQYILTTSIGQVEVTVLDHWIACQFADSIAALVFTSCRGPRTSLYSGKWNFHYFDEPDVLNNGLAIGDFVSAIESLLAYVPTPKDLEAMERLRAMYPRAAKITF